MNRSGAAVGFFLSAAYCCYCLATPGDWHLPDFVNLIFHEAGHTIFRVFGWEFLAVAGGTIMQLLVPFSIAAHFWHTKQRLSAAGILLWCSQSLANVYWYANDAQKMDLELLGGENAIHDWNYMLIHLNLLMQTPQIAEGIYLLAWLTFLGAVGLGAFLLFSSEWNSTERRAL